MWESVVLAKEDFSGNVTCEQRPECHEVSVIAYWVKSGLC